MFVFHSGHLKCFKHLKLFYKCAPQNQSQKEHLHIRALQPLNILQFSKTNESPLDKNSRWKMSTKRELFIKVECPQMKGFRGNCFTISVRSVLAPRGHNGLQYLNPTAKAKCERPKPHEGPPSVCSCLTPRAHVVTCRLLRPAAGLPMSPHPKGWQRSFREIISKTMKTLIFPSGTQLLVWLPVVGSVRQDHAWLRGRTGCETARAVPVGDRTPPDPVPTAACSPEVTSRLCLASVIVLTVVQGDKEYPSVQSQHSRDPG